MLVLIQVKINLTFGCLFFFFFKDSWCRNPALLQVLVRLPLVCHFTLLWKLLASYDFQVLLTKSLLTILPCQTTICFPAISYVQRECGREIKHTLKISSTLDASKNLILPWDFHFHPSEYYKRWSLFSYLSHWWSYRSSEYLLSI